MPKLNETQLAIGGLMRCCTGTITEMFETNPETELSQGQLLDCKYEKKTTMIVDNSIIHWIGLSAATAVENGVASPEEVQRLAIRRLD